MFLVVLTVLLVVFLVAGGVSGGLCIGLDSSSFEFYVHGGARLLGASLETPGDLFGASVELPWSLVGASLEPLQSILWMSPVEPQHLQPHCLPQHL